MTAIYLWGYFVGGISMYLSVKLDTSFAVRAVVVIGIAIIGAFISDVVEKRFT